MKSFLELIAQLGPESYRIGQTQIHIQRESMHIKYKGTQEVLANARTALENDTPVTQNPQSLVLDERINLTNIGCRYAIIHPTTLRESTVKLQAQQNGVTDELLAHLQHDAAQRVIFAFGKGHEVTPPKLSDYLAYAADLVYSTAVYLKDAKGRVLLQQRSKQETSYPLHWQPSANGKLESYLEALKREMGEELGEEIRDMQFPVTLVSETPYVLTKTGVSKPAIGRDYVIEIGEKDILPLLRKSDETEQFAFVAPEDITSGRIISLSQAKRIGATPQTNIILFDDQYASLLRVMGVADTVQHAAK